MRRRRLSCACLWLEMPGMFVLGEGPMRLTFVQRLPELDGRLWGGTQLHGAVIHPREGCGLRGLFLLDALGTLGEATHTSAELAHVLLCLDTLLAETSDLADLPVLDQVIDNVSVVRRSVRLCVLGHRGEVGEQAATGLALVLQVVHQVSRHHDLLPHHLLERAHGAAGVQFEELLDDALVGNLVAPLVSGDVTADLAQHTIAQLLRMTRSRAVTDLRGPLLEGGVDEAQVRVVLRLRVHTAADEVLNRDLNCLHVDLAGEIHVLVHGVAVPVLLRRPGACPSAPGGWRSARLVADAIQGVEHGHIGGQRLLRDHVSRQHHPVVVRQALCALPQLPHLVDEGVGGGVGQQVGRLPALVHVLQHRQHPLLHVSRDAVDHLQPVLAQRVQRLAVEDNGAHDVLALCFHLRWRWSWGRRHCVHLGPSRGCGAGTHMHARGHTCSTGGGQQRGGTS
mmetsp:Transcript_11276/g.33885  ORF Transcript_11276/g.33885 Transcript_11276/m.33885 type:complete len:452 (-) Transcript_11276:226-1581(-)